MKLETIFEKFDELADAPDAVAKIRQLVLDLALNGSLVGLDASKWPRVSLGSLGDWGSGGTPLRSEPQFYGGSIPWLVIGDLNDGVVTSAASTITEEGLANSSARLLPKGVLLIAMYGSIGKMGITGIECATNQAIAFCKPDPKRTDLRYLFHALKGIQPALLARGQGLAQKNISQTILKAWEINLPPLADQNRIVAKVDELMALCDRLEAQLQERERRHSALARASLTRFADAPTPANLPFLFHPSYAIPPADLRKSILTLAVQGKLVPQDPNDEPAEELLWNILGERERLVKTRQIRRFQVPPLEEEDESFPIPQTWVWTRLGTIGDWGSGSTPPRGNHELYGGRITWLKSGELNDNQALAGSSETVTELALKTCSFRQNKPGDVLIAMYGATIGKLAILAEEAVTNQAVCGCTPFPGVLNTFLFYYLLSRRDAFHAASEGGAQPNISKAKIVNSPFPLPPQSEQQRIVAKLEQLMALVGKLETQLDASMVTASNLLSALVAEISR